MTDEEKRSKASEYHRQYREKNKAAIAERTAKWRIENLDRLHQYDKDRYAKNPEIKKIKSKEWYNSNPDRAAASRKKWAVDNQEKRNEISRNWTKRNPDKKKKFSLAWLENNRQEYLDIVKKWRLKNPAKSAAGCARRRKRVIENSTRDEISAASLFMNEMKSIPFGICEYCDGLFSVTDLHFDHVTPLKKGGRHSPDNLALSCKACNQSKGSKILHKEWIPLKLRNLKVD